MDLLFIRHGRAQKRSPEDGGGSDAARKLTGVGRARMKRAARGLGRLVRKADLLLTSPYVRAAQTAEIVAKRLGDIEPVEHSELRPSQRPQALLDVLSAAEGPPEVVAIVGHEPHLGRTISWLLAGRTAPFIDMKKGGACLLRFDSAPAAGKGKMIWLLTGNQLAALGSAGR